MAQKDVQRHRNLWRKGAIAKVKLEEVEGVKFERQRLLEQNQLDVQQARTELEKQQSVYQRQLKELQSQVSDVRSKIAQTQKLIQSVQFQLRQRVLYALTDGTIFQLSIQHPKSSFAVRADNYSSCTRRRTSCISSADAKSRKWVCACGNACQTQV